MYSVPEHHAHVHFASRTFELRHPEPYDEAAFDDARLAVPSDNPTFLRGYRDGMDFAEFLRLLDAQRDGCALADDATPTSFLFAFDDARIVGRASIRHRITAPRGDAEGHIGYAVLPAFRNRGYATRILRAAVDHARHVIGLDRVLVTCDDDNFASIRVIEKNGGLFECSRSFPGFKRPKRRYWIDTASAST